MVLRPCSVLTSIGVILLSPTGPQNGLNRALLRSLVAILGFCLGLLWQSAPITLILVKTR